MGAPTPDVRIQASRTLLEYGFRFFEISPDANIEQLVQKNKFFKNNYKTFLRKKITGVVKMWNPIFSPAMISKLNIQDIV